MTEKRSERSRGKRIFRLLALAGILVVLGGGAITVAWIKPGFVECTGYLEPDDWIPLYTGSEGLVRFSLLAEGMIVNEGDLLVILDDEWPRWNLKRVDRERSILQAEITFLEQNLILFRRHRGIEEEELRRLREADRRLMENSSLTRNELQHSEYLYNTFVAGADREQSELEQQLILDRLKAASLRVEAALWGKRLEGCRIGAPAAGRYYSAETVLSTSAGFSPSFEPGLWVESGRLIGYLIPDGDMKAHIEIPQHRISGCRPGQPVLISVDARPQWRYAPVEGRLESIMTVASRGIFQGTVNLAAPDQIIDELRNLNCGNLTARIDVRKHEVFQDFEALRLSARVWDRWTILVNSAGKVRKNRRSQ